MGLGQATGPQGNPVLWGKERAASPGLMGLGEEGNQPHSSASAPSPVAISSPNPQPSCAVLRSPHRREKDWSSRAHQGQAAVRGICVVSPTPHPNKSEDEQGPGRTPDHSKAPNWRARLLVNRSL